MSYTQEAIQQLEGTLPMYHPVDRDATIRVIAFLSAATVVKLQPRIHYEMISARDVDLSAVALPASITAYEYDVTVYPKDTFNGLDIVHSPKRIALVKDMEQFITDGSVTRTIIISSVFLGPDNSWLITPASVIIDLNQDFHVGEDGNFVYEVNLIDNLPATCKGMRMEVGEETFQNCMLNDLWEEADTVLKALWEASRVPVTATVN